MQNTNFLQMRNHIAVSFFAFLLVWISTNISNNLQQKKAVFKKDKEAMDNKKVVIQTLLEKLWWNQIYLTSFDAY